MDTMVVSQFVGEGSPRPGEPRKIPGGPLYESRDVRSLLDSGPHVLVARVVSSGNQWSLGGLRCLLGRSKRLPRAVARIGTEFYVKFAIHCTGETFASFIPSLKDRRQEK